MSYEFNLDVHRQIARRANSGEATMAEIAASQSALLDEVIRLTGALPVDTGNRVPAKDFGELIAVISKAPKTAIVFVETDGQRALAGGVGSYRGYHDHLRVTIGSAAPRTVSDLLKHLRAIRRSGFEGEGVHYQAPDNTPVWIAEMDDTSDWLLASIRIEAAAVVLVAAAEL